MQKLILLLSLLFLTHSAQAESVVYENTDLGFRLQFPDTFERRSDLERELIRLCLLRSGSTVVLTAGTDNPGRVPAEMAAEVIGVDKPTESIVAGKTFFENTALRVTPAGHRSDRTTLFHYNPETGAFIHILLGTPVGAPEQEEAALRSIVNSLEFF